MSIERTDMNTGSLSASGLSPPANCWDFHERQDDSGQPVTGDPLVSDSGCEAEQGYFLPFCSFHFL